MLDPEVKGQGHKRGGNGDRHVWIYASRVNWHTCLFVCLFFVCPQDFGKGYLRPGLTEVDEI